MKLKSLKSKHLFNLLLPFLLPLLMVGLGIVLIIKSTLVDQMFLAVGILMALIGLSSIVFYVARHKYEKRPRYLIHGIVLMVVGVTFIIIPMTITIFIPIVIGITVLVNGVSGAINTMAFRKENATILIPMLFAIINIALGCFIFIYIWRAQNIINTTIGILLIISGILRIINEVFARISVPKAPQVVETTASDHMQDGLDK